MTITKAGAAQSQLETAITLWFNYGDPVSICTLAYAAQDCYAALSKHIKKPSLYQEWFESQSKEFKKRVRNTLAFFKHGLKKTTGKVSLPPGLSEALIVDSIDCHNRLAGDITVLMSAFNLRFMFETSDAIVSAEHASLFVKATEVYKIGDIPRPDFLKTVLQIAEKRAATGTLGKPEIFGALPFKTGGF